MASGIEHLACGKRLRVVTHTHLLLIVIVGLSVTASAADCTVSKPFKVTRPQQLSGILRDESGAVIANARLELLADDKVAYKALTTSVGAYVFAQVQPGTYTVRVRYGNADNAPFCAPAAKCNKHRCMLSQRVKLNRSYDWVQ